VYRDNVRRPANTCFWFKNGSAIDLLDLFELE
jgi:hypothetical protein